jgi:hypothetical protein
MKKSLLYTAIMSGLLFTGCATVREPVEVAVEPATITFSAEGSSVASPADPLSLAKAELAASTIAKANLLEKLKGSVLANDVKVQDLMFVSQKATLSVYGWVNRVNIEIVEDEVVPTNLPKKVADSDVVTAVATLELTMDEYNNLEDYVE